MHQEPPKEAQDRAKRGQEQPNSDFFGFLASNLGRKIGANSLKIDAFSCLGAKMAPRPPQDPPKTPQDRFSIAKMTARRLQNRFSIDAPGPGLNPSAVAGVAEGRWIYTWVSN